MKNHTIDNPLHLEPGTFFISGPVPPSTGLGNPDFEKYEKLLTERGYKVFNPEANVHCKDVNVRINFMVMCEKVITLENFMMDERSKLEAQIARMMNKELILAEGFGRWEQRKKATEDKKATAQSNATPGGQ